jgi:hypothetical protein
MKYLLSATLILLLVACGTKPIRAPYQHSSKPASADAYYQAPRAQVEGEFVKHPQQKSTSPQAQIEHPRYTQTAPQARVHYHLPRMTREEVYSLRDLSIGQFEASCDDLYFRVDDLVETKLKSQPISAIEALFRIKTNLHKKSCSR